jgi:hypothetical protein
VGAFVRPSPGRTRPLPLLDRAVHSFELADAEGSGRRLHEIGDAIESPIEKLTDDERRGPCSSGQTYEHRDGGRSLLGARSHLRRRTRARPDLPGRRRRGHGQRSTDRDLVGRNR